MRKRALLATTALGLTLGLSATAAFAAPTNAGNPRQAGPLTVALSPVGTYATGIFNESAAEIVVHDAQTQRLFVVNAAAALVDVLDVRDASNPVKLFSIATAGVKATDGSVIPEGGSANSVAVRNGLVAIAVEAPVKTDAGWLVLADTDGNVHTAVRVGSLPDMVTFTPDGRTILVANEGEPAEDYAVDPEGSVSIIPVGPNGKIAGLEQSDVRTATFHAWDAGTKSLHADVRVFGPNEDSARRISENLEPEYIVVDDKSRTAYVILQEANAFGVLDLRAGEFTDIVPFGFKDWTLPDNVLDVSDRDGSDEGGMIRLENWPVKGIYQPDGAASYSWRGQTLLVTPNEGDSRDWDGFSEESRFRSWSNGKTVCEDSPLDAWLKSGNVQGITTLKDLRDNANMGRLNITTTLGFNEADNCIEDVYAYGARSFSIWTTTGEQLFDSGGQFEQIIAELNPEWFNSNHNENSFETRSDDKGPEPESVAVGEIKGRTYAFVGLERIGGIMTWDITDPRNVFFVDYVNNRNFDAAPGTPESLDQGAEGVTFIAGKDSPTGEPMLAVGNEVSGTTTLFAIDVTNERAKKK